MGSPSKTAQHLIGDRVSIAKVKTRKVQSDIQLAEAELHLANQVITNKLAKQVNEAAMDKLIVHNETVEEKLRDATEELEVVTDLLHSEEQDRIKLEESLAVCKAADSSAQPAGTRSGEGSASVIEHLRELTRHKLTADAAEPAKSASPKAKSRAGSTPRRPQP